MFGRIKKSMLAKDAGFVCPFQANDYHGGECSIRCAWLLPTTATKTDDKTGETVHVNVWQCAALILGVALARKVK